MEPVLFRSGNLIVPSYSFMLSLSFLVGGSLLVLLGVKRGASAYKLVGLVVVVQIAAAVGSRALFLLNESPSFGVRFSRVLAISPGGFALNGGVTLSLLTTWLYLRLAKLPFWSVADWAAPSLAVGIFLTRLGCFLGGCCYGKPTALPWGVQFPPGSLAARTVGFPHLVHPTQLYEGLAGLAMLGLILAWRKRPAFEGQSFLILGLLYMAVRILNDFFRGDALEDYLWQVTQTQVFSLILGTAIFLFGDLRQ